MKNKYYILLCIGYLVYVLYRLYWFGQADGCNTYQFFVYIFGTINLSAGNNFVWKAALWMIPQFLVIAACAKYFESQFISNTSILLIRTSNRTKLVTRFAFKLGVKAAIFIMAEVLSALIIGLISQSSLSGFSWQALIEIGNAIGSMMGFVLFINVLALFIDPIYAIIIFLLLEWMQLFLVQTFHSIRNFVPVIGLLQEFRTDGSICDSIMVLACVILWDAGIVCLGACLFQKKKDIF